MPEGGDWITASLRLCALDSGQALGGFERVACITRRGLRGAFQKCVNLDAQEKKDKACLKQR